MRPKPGRALSSNIWTPLLNAAVSHGRMSPRPPTWSSWSVHFSGYRTSLGRPVVSARGSNLTGRCGHTQARFFSRHSVNLTGQLSCCSFTIRSRPVPKHAFFRRGTGSAVFRELVALKERAELLLAEGVPGLLLDGQQQRFHQHVLSRQLLSAPSTGRAHEQASMHACRMKSASPPPTRHGPNKS